MTFGLSIAIEQHGDKQVLILDGRVDTTTTPSLEKELNHLLEAKHKKVILDFGKVDYLSSAGLRLLLSSTKKFQSHGGQLSLCDIGEEVMEIMKMAGFERVLLIYPNLHEALKV
jgi:anti-sigma B factor antagonist/stage II sporulation protein AA (anti-sigma F factor antagonist)